MEADINNNNYEEQFQILLQTNPTPTILDLHTHFPYLSHHWDGPYQQAFEEDHPFLCDYYGNLLQQRYDIFISSPDYQLKNSYIPLIYPNITFNHYLPQPIHPTLWDRVYTLPTLSRPNTYEELLHFATVNLLPLPLSPTLYDQICIQEPSLSDDEDSEENFETYDDPDLEDADIEQSNHSEFEDDDNDEDLGNDENYSEFL